MKTNLLPELMRLLADCRSICLLGHKSPDGDCLMAALAMQACLRRMGKKTAIAFEGQVPYNYDHYYDCQLVLENPPRKLFDAAIALDCANSGRLGKWADMFHTTPINVVIDHHLTNTGFGIMNILNCQVSSTCELIYTLFESVNFPISQEIAEFLYVGILTDTGKFRYPVTSGHTHRVIGALIDGGVRPDEVYKRIFRHKPPGLAKACGAGMAGLSLHFSGQLAVTRITTEIASYNDGKIDEIDGLIDWLMDLRGVKIACVLKEKEGHTKVSLRSGPGYALHRLAAKFQGGGHSHAAGFSLSQPLATAEATVIKELADIIIEASSSPGLLN